MAGEFGTGKTVLILAIVAGCFAVLWPKLFYPMLQASVNARNKDLADTSQACCDVIFENDVNAIKIMTEMCGNILHRYDDFDPKLIQAFHQGKLTKEIVSTCRKEVLDTCGIDITAFLNERVRLGKTYKQILDDIRSFNSSECLKQNFGVNPGLLGAPHRMRISAVNMPSHHRQERPPHLRPDLLHPALQERGRAIPHSHVVPKVIEKEGKPPGPIPGMRPPMGGAGHVVPAPKGSGGTMGIIMPLYTVGIVVFFMYTIMKMLFKKATGSTDQCEDFSPDPEFRKMVFAEEYYASQKSQIYEEHRSHHQSKRETSPPSIKTTDENGTKLVVTAITGLLAEVDHQRETLAKRAEEQISTVIKSEDKLEDEIQNSQELVIHEVQSGVRSDQVDIASHVDDSVDESNSGGAKVKIVGMEMTASCEGGQKWSRPGTPILAGPSSRSATPVSPPTPEPQSIFLEGSLPSQSQLIVTDSETQALPGEAGEDGSDMDPPVILSGKMTLSLISLDAALAAEDEQHRQQRKQQDALRNAASPVPPASKNIKEEIPAEIEDDEEEYEEEEEDEEKPEDKLKEKEKKEEVEEEGEEEEEEEEEDEEEEEEEEDEPNLPAVNNTQTHSDKTATSANYTTASAAAEATGPEETAADVSAIDLSLPDDQELDDDLEDEEEVWNGDVESEEEEGEESEEEEEVQAIPRNPQRQHQR